MRSSGGGSGAPPTAPPRRGSAASGVLLGVLVGWTLLGNGLVVAAVLCSRHLRARVTHLFVVSLAVSDLLVALLVMPWAAAAEVAGEWPFGGFCEVWVAFDIMCCTASILNLCLISLDRYWAIASPFRYQRKMTPRLALTMVGTAWALALLISFVPVQLQWHRSTQDPNADSATTHRLGPGPGSGPTTTAARWTVGSGPALGPIATTGTRRTVGSDRSAIPGPASGPASSWTEAPRTTRTDRPGSSVIPGLASGHTASTRTRWTVRSDRNAIPAPTTSPTLPQTEAPSATWIAGPGSSVIQEPMSGSVSSTGMRWTARPGGSVVLGPTVDPVTSTGTPWMAGPGFSGPTSPGIPGMAGAGSNTTPGSNAGTTSWKEASGSPWMAGLGNNATPGNTWDANTSWHEGHNPHWTDRPNSNTTPGSTTESITSWPEGPRSTHWTATTPTAQRCDASLNRTYAISSSLISFYIPVAIMIVTYTRIYRIAQVQIRRISSLERAAEHAQSCHSGISKDLNCCAPHQHHHHHHHHSGLKSSIRKETKVLKTLSVIMGVFVCCWLPFFILNCIVPFCQSGPDDPQAGLPCVSDTTFNIFVWFGWANSSLNPIIYAFNADFRRVFSHLLGCGQYCSSTPVETVNLSNELISYNQDTLFRRDMATACVDMIPHTVRGHHEEDPFDRMSQISPHQDAVDSACDLDCEGDISLDKITPLTTSCLL